MRKPTLTLRPVHRSLVSVLIACGMFAAVASIATAVPIAADEGPDPVGEVVTDVVSDDAAQHSGELAFTGASDQTPWFALGAVLAILVGMVMIGMTLRPEPVLVEMRSLRPIRPVDPRRRRTHAPD